MKLYMLYGITYDHSPGEPELLGVFDSKARAKYAEEKYNWELEGNCIYDSYKIVKTKLNTFLDDEDKELIGEEYESVC